MEENQRVLKCSASTDANKLARSIYSIHREDANADIIVRVIGAGALNQAVKASIISNKFFSNNGIVIGLRPSFKDASDSITAIELRILFIKV